MTMALFPCLPGTTLDAVNTVGAWLAQDDYQDNQPVDLVILAGNAVIPAIDAACKIAAEQGVPLIISGGIGHSTTFLYAAIAKHPAITGYPPPGGQRRLFWPTSPVNSGTFRLSIFTLRISRPTVAKTPASAGR